MVTYNVAFSTRPTFALLLHGISFQIGTYLHGYYAVPGTLTSVNAQFSISYSGNAYSLYRVKFRWVASQGEHLQLFTMTASFESGSIDLPFVFSLPFDYPNLVKWSSGTFEVGITAVLSSVYHPYRTYIRAGVTIAKWDGASRYVYSGAGRYVLNKDSLFGPNCPFTTVNGQNVVKLMGQANINSVFVFYLLFHKVQLTGSVQTGFGVVRSRSRDIYTGAYSDNIADPTYNVAITDPKAVRIYGFEAYVINSQRYYAGVLEISTTNGIETIGLRDFASPGSTSEFYATYLTPAVPAGCPIGCNCDSGIICSSGQAFHVQVPVTLGGFAYCPCLASFFWEADGTCKPCPKNLYCDTCHYNTNGQFSCTACKCSQHRELNNGNCVCKSGYGEPTPAGPYCARI